jgi:hypothetical protein
MAACFQGEAVNSLTNKAASEHFEKYSEALYHRENLSTLLLAKPGPVLGRADEGFDHFSLLIVAVEVIQLG